MTYIFFLLIILAFYYLLKCYIHRFSWYYFGLILSLALTMYTTFCLISSTGNYTTLGYIFGDFDKALFLKLISNKLNYFLLIRTFNISTAAYLIFSTMFICSYFGKKSFSASLNVKMIVFSVFTATIHILSYDPTILYRIYFYILDNHIMAFQAVKIANIFLHTMLYGLLVSHIIYIFHHRQLLISRLKLKQSIGLIIFVLSSDILYLILLNLSNLRNILINSPYELVNIKHNATLLKREFFIYIIIMFVTVITMFFVTNTCYLIRTNSFIQRLRMKREYRRFNKNLINVFHSVKNHVLSFRTQLTVAQMLENTEKDAILKSLENNITNYIEELSKMLNTDEISKNILPEEINVITVLNMAIDSIEIPKNITVTRQYNDIDDIVFVDAYYMSDAFKNIIKNSIDAINTLQIDNGEIIVSTQRDFDHTLITINDNGSGMTKKEIKKIFDPFYTTKSRIVNWGIGLSSVYNTINSHNGNIWVKSEKNSGTTFYITIPLK